MRVRVCEKLIIQKTRRDACNFTAKSATRSVRMFSIIFIFFISLSLLYSTFFVIFHFYFCSIVCWFHFIICLFCFGGFLIYPPSHTHTLNLPHLRHRDDDDDDKKSWEIKKTRSLYSLACFRISWRRYCTRTIIKKRDPLLFLLWIQFVLRCVTIVSQIQTEAIRRT